MKFTDRPFDEYLAYLSQIRADIPPQVYAFAADANRHSLDSPSSLHDCWLSGLSVSEERAPERPFRPTVSVRLRLLGQRHDRFINLTYHDVCGYELVGRRNRFNPADTFHGDVARHEVRLHDGKLVHEIEFASGSRIVVECTSFDVAEESIEQPRKPDAR